MEEQKKSRGQIHFRITPAEAAIIEQKASAAGLSPTMYAKKQALEGKVKASVITKDIGQLILPELAKIGSNINQIARKLNLGDLVLPSEFKEVQAEFETLWAYVLEGKKPKKQEEPQAEVSFPSASVEEHTCSKCGEVLKFKHSDKQCKDYWICPNYSKEDKGHTFEWVE